MRKGIKAQRRATFSPVKKLFYRTVVVKRIGGKLPFQVADTEDGVIVISSEMDGRFRYCSTICLNCGIQYNG
jgi:hypothetical protein